MRFVPEPLREVVEQIATSPKIAVAASTGTAAMGAAADSIGIHGFLVDASMAAGLIVTAILGCCHMVKFAILRQELKNARRAAEQFEKSKNQGE